MTTNLTSITGINSVIKHMQEIHRGVRGVQTAPLTALDYPSGNINNADMPFVYVMPGEGDHNNRALGDVAKDTRMYIVSCIVGHYNQGIGGEMIFIANDLLWRLPKVYIARSYLDTDQKMRIVKTIGFAPRDTGIQNNIYYKDDPYYGFELFVYIELSEDC